MILSGVFALLLIHSGLSADTKELACGDSSTFGIRERAAITSMGKEIWTCADVVNSSDGKLAGTGSSEHPSPKDFDLCQASCKIYCEKPVLNGGPDIDDCLELVSYYANAGEFIIEPLKYVVWEYKTCRVIQYNRLKNPKQRIRYCFDQDHWAGVVSRISSRCGSEGGSHGGSCYFYDSLHYSSITLEKV